MSKTRKSRKKLKTSHDFDETTCKLCFSNEENDAIYGEKLKTEIGTVHYYCILFACGLEQKGSDEQGLYGFLSEDIRKEILRANKLRCSFCKINTCASACAIKQCRVTFHFNCGLKNNVLYHYFESFPAYCQKHRPPLPDSYSNLDPELACAICLTKFKDFSQNDDSENKINDNKESDLKYKILLTECCSKFLHIDCAKKHAYNHGLYHIKCPLCNNDKQYINCLNIHGCFIPEKDASWESQYAQTWREQESCYAKCDADVCKNKYGRYYTTRDCSTRDCENADQHCKNQQDCNEQSCSKQHCNNQHHCNNIDCNNQDWEIVVCNTCGSYGIHIECYIDKEQIDEENYECPNCNELSMKINNNNSNNGNEHLNYSVNNQINEQLNNQINNHLNINESDNKINVNQINFSVNSLENENTANEDIDDDVIILSSSNNDDSDVIILNSSAENIDCQFEDDDKVKISDLDNKKLTNTKEQLVTSNNSN